MDDFEQYSEGYDGFKRVTEEITGESRHGVYRTLIVKREIDEKYFSIEYCYTDQGIKDSNIWPLEAVEVFPVTKITVVYE